MKPLNPIMAVLAIASVGVFPLRALAADGSKPAGAVVAVEDTNSIDALSKVLAGKPAARADAAARITKFLFDDFEVTGESGRK
ncbi:MAG: hypothetical protein NUW21_15040, partial [Elusimicrobia bacterium]|nr:hypothetical protein [Elusimicrobiota bacterium]